MSKAKILEELAKRAESGADSLAMDFASRMQKPKKSNYDTEYGSIQAYRDGDDLVVGTVKVNPNERGKGYGKELYKGLIEQAKEQGFKRIVSDETIEEPVNSIYKSLARDGYKVKASDNLKRVEATPSVRGVTLGNEKPFYHAGDESPYTIDLTADSLALDFASRMQRAREQGFDTDTVYYHGTNADFDEFRVNDDGVNLVGKGVYAAPSGTASGYASDVGSSVYPLLVKGKKASFQDAADAREAIGDGWTNDSVNDWLKDRGFTHRDGRQGIVIFDHEKNIRSPNAAFDPAKKDSSNLLASAGAGIGALGLMGASDDSSASNLNLSQLLSMQGEPYTEQTAQAARYPVAGSIADTLGRLETPIGRPFAGLSDYVNKINYGDDIGILDRLGAVPDPYEFSKLLE